MSFLFRVLGVAGFERAMVFVVGNKVGRRGPPFRLYQLGLIFTGELGCCCQELKGAVCRWGRDWRVYVWGIDRAWFSELWRFSGAEFGWMLRGGVLSFRKYGFVI